MTKEQLNNLLSQMTIEEKIGQLVQLTTEYFNESGEITGPLANLDITEEQVNNCGSVIGAHGAKVTRSIQEQYLAKSRLKIPLVFMSDIVHGSNTIFPSPLGLSSSFNPENAKICSQVAAKEACVQGHHVTFAPMVDLARDARWGRNMETTGEDPYLNSLYARAFVEGFQGNSLTDENTIAACVKHFAAYGMVLAGREYNMVDLSERFLREWHFPSYRAGIDAGSAMVMTSFNTVNSVPATGNKWLMNDVLRGEMGFDGAVISDWGAVKEQLEHRTAANEKEAAIKALNAGCDMEMMTPCYYHTLKEAYENGEVSMELIDTSVMRMLELKNKLGLFENPYRFGDEAAEKTVLLSDEFKSLAKKVSDESIVLLKNNGVLPLENANVVLTGPLSDSNDLMGPWSWQGRFEDVVKVKDALSEAHYIETSRLTNAQISYLSGTVIYVGGEYGNESGEAHSKTNIDLSENQVNDIKRLKAQGLKVVLVLFNGRPLALREILNDVDAIVECWHLGTMAGSCVRDVLLGKVNPSGKLTMSFPYNTGQCPIFYNDFPTGRPLNSNYFDYVSKYEDAPNTPLFSFGHGLNYSDIKITDIKYSSTILEDEIKVDVTLTNTGRTGVEVVQLYVKDLAADVIRPNKELKAFNRVEVKDTAAVTLKITKDMLMYYNDQCEFKYDAGQFEIMIGLNSIDIASTIIVVK